MTKQCMLAEILTCPMHEPVEQENFTSIKMQVHKFALSIECKHQQQRQEKYHINTKSNKDLMN